MKKLLALLLIAIMAFTLVACGGDSAEEESGAEIALVTDVGTIDDRSFNQGAWEGVEAYCEDNGVTYAYYQPTENSDVARMEQIDNAVVNGAKIVVTPGFLFNTVILEAQDKYPDVNFIFLDGVPQDADFNVRIEANTVGVLFAEQEAGYLAGYAAVKEGYTSLGFLGGMAVPAVVRFGYGFVEGAEDAAQELGLDSVEIKYGYTGTFEPSPDIQTKAASWYNDGTEVIFACGGGIWSNIDAAADEAGALLIGVDSDQNHLSENFLTSSMKGLQAATYQIIESVYNDTFQGGETVILGAAEEAVGLPMDTSTFETFTQDDYDTLFAMIQDGSVDIVTDADVASAAEIATDIVTVTIVE